MDAVGRSILQASDYRLIALITLVACGGFLLLRRLRSEPSPDIAECLRLVAGIFSIFSALTVGVVFLLTRPPAIELVSGETLAITGVAVVVSVIGQSTADIKTLLAPKPKAAGAGTGKTP